jgi:hypothetical protein
VIHSFRPILCAAAALALLCACARLASPQAGGANNEESEYQRKLDMYGTGSACPDKPSTLWGAASADHIGLMGFMESSNGGVLERTLIIGQNDQARAVLTCVDGVVDEKNLCTPGTCNTCTSNDQCNPAQTCVRARCK